MPLDDGYGVVIGTFASFERDDPDSYGNYYHGILKINAPNGLYTCAIDVDTPNASVGVEYKILRLSPDDLSPIYDLAQGYHSLASTATSGATDYIRSPHLVPRLPAFVRRRLIFFFMGHIVRLVERLLLKIGFGWTRDTGDNTLNVLEGILNSGTITRIFVFGEPFVGGDLGIHNIHQNQGDPIGTRWWPENGIWQDGATIIEKADGSITVFLNKFTSQSYVTDNDGHPA